MSVRSGLSRGDRNRNERLARLRELVPAGNAIVGIDLADVKQAIVVTDHEDGVYFARCNECLLDSPPAESRASAEAWALQHENLH